MRRLALLALFLPLLACAATPCTDTCKTLVDEGNVFASRNEPQQAYDKYQAAIAAAPESTWPMLVAATMLLDLSWHSAEPQAAQLHGQADALARQALRLAPGDAMVQDVLRQILEGPPVRLHQPTPAAAATMREAELLFQQRRFDEARAKYEAVMTLDPLSSSAWVGAGDCYFTQQDWPRAEAQYRRATGIEPRNAQAWRYLADALRKQGKTGPAGQALYAAIAASPADRNTWAHLASLRKQEQMPLKSLHLKRGSSVTVGADGKYAVQVHQGDLPPNSPPDMAFAISLALLETRERMADVDKNRSAYDIELETWRTALKIADETSAASGNPLTDPALLQMQAFGRDGQLEPALLILTYRPPYRAAFDAWLAAHPDGVQAFIDRYSLQP